MAEEGKRPAVSPRARLYQLTSLAFTFPVSIAAGGFAGYWLDGKLGTFPWLSIVFLILGIVAAFVSFFRAIKAYDREN